MPTYSWNRAAVQKRVGAGQQLRYRAGQGYWVGPRLGPARPTPQAPLPALINRLSSQRQTPQQQLGLAQSLVNTSLAAQKADVEAQTRKAQQEAGQQAYAARGFALALGGMDQANAQQIRDTYAAAGNDMGKFGHGLAEALGKTQQGAVDAAQAAVGARTGDIVQAVAPSAYANAANFQGELAAAVPHALAAQYSLGGVPSNPLNPDASPLVTPSQARLASIGEEYVAKAGEARTAAGEAIAKIAATRPGLVEQALQQIQSSGRSDDAALIQALYLLQTTDKNAFEQSITKAGLTGTYKGKPTVAAKTAAAAAAAKAEANRIAAMNARTNQTKAQAAVINAKAAREAAAAVAAGKQGESTKTFRGSYGTHALSYVREVLGIDPKKPGRGAKYRPPSKAALVRSIYNIYGAPFAGKYGLTAPQLKSWANKVVETLPNKYWTDKYWADIQRAKDAAKGDDSIDSILK